jgi:hypothetical protein
VNESNLPDNVKQIAITAMQQFAIIENKNQIDTQMGLLVNGLDSDTYQVLFKAISVKAQLISFNLDDLEKVSKKLETIFTGIEMTKPIIALRVRHHINIGDLTTEKRGDLEEIFRGVFS